MARIPKGILGNVSGSVGTVVGSSWKGIDYLRSKSKARRSKVSPAQEVQRAKFKLVSDFLSTIKELILFSFSDFEVDMTGRNTALAYTLKNAVSGDYPDLELQYSKALVARGNKLPKAMSPQATAGAPGEIAFSWTDNSGSGIAKPTDESILVAHCPELNESHFTASGAPRNAGSAVLNVSAFSGKQVHTWIAFISENGREIATSVYTGALKVQ